MSDYTVTVDNYEVEVDVSHFVPALPMRWAATPEESYESEEYELTFEVVSAIRITDIGEFPTRDDIEDALVAKLH